MTMKQPETSLAAFRSITEEKLSIDHSRIIEALKTIGIGNYELIALTAKMDKIAVGRRLKELEEKQVIYKPGSKSFLKSGRYGFNYVLCNPVKTDRQEKKPIVKPAYSLPTLF